MFRKHRIFTLISLFSTLLCIAAAIADNASLREHVLFKRKTVHTCSAVTIDSDCIRYPMLNDPSGRVIELMGTGGFLSDLPTGVGRDLKIDLPERINFYFFGRDQGRSPDFQFYLYDAWISYEGIILATALLPASWFALAFTGLVRHRKRRSRALCQKCGYDLRGTHDKCPECGTRSAK